MSRPWLPTEVATRVALSTNMRIAYLRAGAYALLATSLINAAYQGAEPEVLANALRCAALASLLLVTMSTPSGKTLLSLTFPAVVAWTVIGAGIAINLVS